MVRRVLSIEQAKTLPAIAEQTFANWAKNNASRDDEHFYWHGSEQNTAVVLWADTVNAHYSPQLLTSAVNVLLQSQFQVAIAKAHFCCGRPLYELGFLDHEQLYPELPADAALVVMEPSCLSVFKDEIMKLFPNSEPAIDLSERTLSLAQLLKKHGIKPTKRLQKGLLHTHCHDKSLQSDTADSELVRACFESITEPEPGCCGMAGSFGLHEKTQQIGSVLFQRNLGPAIEQCNAETFIVSNGFSCRSQIVSSTNKPVYHFIEILEQCL